MKHSAFKLTLFLTVVSGLLYAEPRKRLKVSITGDTILQEGIQACYTITVKNNGKKDLANVILSTSELAYCETPHSELRFCSVTASMLEISIGAAGKGITIIGTIPTLKREETATVRICLEAGLLSSNQEIKTVRLSATAAAEGIDAKSNMAIIIYKPIKE